MKYGPGLSLTLEEIRLQYSIEDNRHLEIQNKASFLLTLIGVLIPLFIFLSDKYHYFLFGLSIFLMVISGILAFIIIFPKHYYKPHKPYEDFYQYTKLNQKVLKDQYTLNYIASILKIEKRNNSYSVILIFIYFFTLIAILIQLSEYI